MTEEELKQKIADEVIRELPYPYEDDPIPESIANQILTLIREAGYHTCKECDWPDVYTKDKDGNIKGRDE